MTYEELINKIKTKGYWRILFEPLGEENKLTELPECKTIIEKNAVHLRGWPYPFVPNWSDDERALEFGQNYCQGWINLEKTPFDHKEFWRMYQSTQFIHYIALYEDWISNLQVVNMWERDKKFLSENQGLGFLGTVYFITEIYQFISRLALGGLYDNGVKINISLNNTKNRMLFVDDPRRFPFSTPKKSIEQQLSFEKKYTKEELLSNPIDSAREVIFYFFARFQWENPSIDVIKNDQENLINRKI